MFLVKDYLWLVADAFWLFAVGAALCLFSQVGVYDILQFLHFLFFDVSFEGKSDVLDGLFLLFFLFFVAVDF